MACPKCDWIVGVAIIIYYATAITELVSSVPVGLVLNDYKGHCIFSAKVTYYEAATTFPFQEGFEVNKFGSKHSCEFCTYLTIITILFPLIYGSYSLYAICKSLENATYMWVLPALMINSLLLVLKFISSCILSVGVSQLCTAVTKTKYIKMCKDGQKEPWFQIPSDQIPVPEPIMYNGKNYHSYLATAQSASWFCVFEWFLLVVLTFLHYRRNISHRSRADRSELASSNVYGSSAGATQPLPGNTVIINPNYKPS